MCAGLRQRREVEKERERRERERGRLACGLHSRRGWRRGAVVAGHPRHTSGRPGRQQWLRDQPDTATITTTNGSRCCCYQRAETRRTVRYTYLPPTHRGPELSVCMCTSLRFVALHTPLTHTVFGSCRAGLVGRARSGCGTWRERWVSSWLDFWSATTELPKTDRDWPCCGVGLLLVIVCATVVYATPCSKCDDDSVDLPSPPPWNR